MIGKKKNQYRYRSAPIQTHHEEIKYYLGVYEELNESEVKQRLGEHIQFLLECDEKILTKGSFVIETDYQL